VSGNLVYYSQANGECRTFMRQSLMLMASGWLTNVCSVVQRQMWLMYNVSGMSTERAYDIARKEFYALRHEEAVEQRIAREEARMVGGYFGKSALQLGMDAEDITYERWKKWAAEQMSLRDAAQSSAIQSFGESTVDEDTLDDGTGTSQVADTR
jgi:hypothetical protein